MRTRRSGLATLAVAVALGLAATNGAADEPAGLSASGRMRDALAKLGDGRDVELVLNSGKSYRGKLGAVGNDTVIVTHIVGKEFYDVLIDMDAVAAVELRVRDH